MTEPLYGMYIMVPELSKSKVEMAMKYLNWLADPEKALKVCYTPEVNVSEDGAPITMSEEELLKKGYSRNPEDYCIVNAHFDFVENKDAQVSFWASYNPWEKREWFENFYDICATDQFVFPDSNRVLGAEANTKADWEKMIVEYAYNLIACPKVDFDETLDREYKKLIMNGVGDVLRERAEIYDKIHRVGGR